MRVNVWLVVLSVGFVVHHSSVTLVAGAPPDTASVSDAVHEDAAVVIEVPPNTPPPRPPVQLRLYRSPDVASDVLQAALNVASATFAAASVDVD